MRREWWPSIQGNRSHNKCSLLSGGEAGLGGGGRGAAGRPKGMPSFSPAYRHLLNVTWEGRDFSFSPGGYLVQPTMVVIALNRHRLWEMVRRG